MTTTYVVATIHPWNIEAYHRRSAGLAGNWHLIESPDKLTADRLDSIRPRYVLFPHWSWKVPAEIVQAHECVCFHMTDLPYGRGGSPLQNLIARGHEETKITALRMEQGLDSGPIYMKRSLSLAGRAQEIFERAAEIVWDMIEMLVSQDIRPEPQAGEPEYFTRREPKQSVLPEAASVEQLYDHVRMLDAVGYPAAYLDHGEFRLEFTRGQMIGHHLEARVVIRKRGVEAEKE